MRIAVTGASGFIGTEVREALRRQGNAEVIGITRDEATAEGNDPGCRWVSSDYSLQSLSHALQGVDAVIHLAAVRGTGGQISDYHVNEIITENLLGAMKQEGVPHIVFASSIAVYSDLSAIPWKETDPLSPKTLYGISKAACEYLCAYYCRSSGMRCSIVRAAQVMGPGEKNRNMMAVFLDIAGQGGQLRVIGRSRAKRQYIYSRDLAEILCRTAYAKAGGSLIVNAGMERAYTNLEIARLVNEAFGNQTPILYEDQKEEVIEPSEMNTGILTNTLGYEPLTMEEALADIAGRMILERRQKC